LPGHTVGKLGITGVKMFNIRGQRGCSVPVLITKYYSGNPTEKNEMGGASSTDGRKRCAYRILVGRPEERRPLGRRRRRWDDNIKMDHQDVGWGMDWIELTLCRDRWRAVVNAVMNLRFP
jgi:hypothetical protein